MAPFASSQSDARAQKKPKSISVEEFDRKFDDGEDISEYLDWESARRPGLETRRVNVDFPTWMIDGLDRYARKLGVTRQAVIKTWIADRLEDVDLAKIVRDRQGQESVTVRFEDL